MKYDTSSSQMNTNISFRVWMDYLFKDSFLYFQDDCHRSTDDAFPSDIFLHYLCYNSFSLIFSLGMWFSYQYDFFPSDECIFISFSLLCLPIKEWKCFKYFVVKFSYHLIWKQCIWTTFSIRSPSKLTQATFCGIMQFWYCPKFIAINYLFYEKLLYMSYVLLDDRIELLLFVYFVSGKYFLQITCSSLIVIFSSVVLSYFERKSDIDKCTCRLNSVHPKLHGGVCKNEHKIAFEEQQNCTNHITTDFKEQSDKTMDRFKMWGYRKLMRYFRPIKLFGWVTLLSCLIVTIYGHIELYMIMNDETCRISDLY